MFELAPEIIGALCLVAMMAGFIDAIAGGGGLLTIPALLAAGFDPVSAIATNKLQSSVGTAAATWTYWRRGLIDLRALAVPLIATLVGAAAGAFALTLIDSRWLAGLLPILLIGIALYFWLGPRPSEEDRQARLSIGGYAPVAAGIGFYDGFFGPGTGSFFTLSLVTLMGMGLIRATANTKALNLTSNVVSVVLLGFSGHMHWLVGLCMAAGNFVGASLGSRAALQFGPALIRPLLVIVSLGMMLKLLSDPHNPLGGVIRGYF